MRPDARVELLEGRIIDMSPIGPFHGGVVNELNAHFNGRAKDRWIVSIQNSLHIDDFSEPQPDLTLLRPVAHKYYRRHPRAEDVFLLIEVSDSTLQYDRAGKLPVYSRAGVPEVWIVNLVDEVIEIYRQPNFSGYGSKAVLGLDDIAIPEAFPDAGLQVSELFGR